MLKKHIIQILLPVLLIASANANTGEQPDADGDEWSVSDPPGQWTSIPIDTTRITWSDVDVAPDGQSLIFHMLGDIYRVGIDGGDALALTTGIEWNFQPKFSPDGRNIAFISDRGGAENIWIMGSDGSAPRAVTTETEHLLHNPAWSPDGEFIAARKSYVTSRSIPAGSIWLYHRAGGQGTEVVSRLHGDESQKNIAEPAFSADGRYLYFSQDATSGRVWEYNRDATEGLFEIRKLDTESGDIVTVVSGPGGAIRPVPSPDNRHLAFVRRNATTLSSRLVVKNLESGSETTLYHALDRDKQETSGDMGNYPAFAWFPGGRELVFWSGGGLHRVDLDGNHSEIPVRVQTEIKVHPAVRFQTEVAPDTFPVRMHRWTQYSPDGTLAAYQALGYIWIHDFERDERRRLTPQTDHFEFHPRFSPDGRHIVYTTWHDEELGSVRIKRIENGTSRVLTVQPGHYVEPMVSPDGTRVVFRKITGGHITSPLWSRHPGLYLVPVDGNAPPERILDTGRDPQFNSDGSRVLFSERENRNLLLKSVNLEGRDERQHYSGEWVTEYRVSPDGRWLAFVEHHNAWVTPFVAAGRSLGISGSARSFPVRQVSARAGGDLHWSAGSEILRWSHGSNLYERKLSDAFAFFEDAPEQLPEPAETGIDLSFEADADRPNGLIALSEARVITMRDADRTEEVLENATVLIDGNRIAAVGPTGEVQLPEDTRIISLEGRTIMPGLIDIHAHGAVSNNQLTPQQNRIHYSMLAFGVTTIHDPSNDSRAIFSAAELQRTGGIVAPRIFSTGRILYGALSPGATARIDNYDDAEFHVRRLKELGAISVKSYNYLRRDQRQQVLEAGRTLGIMVLPEGGMRFEQNMTHIVDGHTGIEHSLPVQNIYDDVLQLWSGTEVGYSPTLSVAYGGLWGEEYFYDRTEVWKNERLLRYTPTSQVYPRAIRRRTAPDEHYNHIWVARAAKSLNELGVPVVIGAHGQREGLAAHWEIWMMEQGGFTPWEAIRGATIDGARYLGMQTDIGSIEPGKLADLVVVDGNPLEDIRLSEFVSHTMINGRLYESETMNQIAPASIERRPFFFETEGGDVWQDETMEHFRELGLDHGWQHNH